MDGRVSKNTFCCTLFEISHGSPDVPVSWKAFSHWRPSKTTSHVCANASNNLDTSSGLPGTEIINSWQRRASVLLNNAKT